MKSKKLKKTKSKWIEFVCHKTHKTLRSVSGKTT